MTTNGNPDLSDDDLVATTYMFKQRQDWYAGALRQILELPEPRGGHCDACAVDVRAAWKAVLIARHALDVVELGGIPQRWEPLLLPGERP